jgi:hypothetical protein
MVQEILNKLGNHTVYFWLAAVVFVEGTGVFLPAITLLSGPSK